MDNAERPAHFVLSLFSSAVATGVGFWGIMERVVTVLSVLSLVIGIAAGTVTLINQWAIRQARKQAIK